MGSFSRDAEGRLVTMQGHPVLSADGGEIVFAAGDGTPVIKENGDVLVAGQVRGNVGVLKFDNPQQLIPIGSGMYKSDTQPQPAEEHLIMQGALEESNVSGVSEVTRLIEIQRHATMTANFIKGRYSTQKGLFKRLAQTGGGTVECLEH